MDKVELQEGLKKIIDIKSVFIKAKNDNGKTFLDEIERIDKNILKEQLKNYGDNPEKINKVRFNIINSFIEGKKLNLTGIDEILKKESIKYKKNTFKSWKNFSILHGIYYFDKKKFVNDFFQKLHKKLIFDLDLEGKIKINIVDFQGAQNFGDNRFWTAIYNKSHKSQKTALQLNITSSNELNGEPLDGYKISLGLGHGPDVEKNYLKKHKIFNVEDLDYKIILEEFGNLKSYILKDNKKQFWTYFPGKNAKNWEVEKEENYISIGWDKLGNLEKYKTRKDLEKEYLEVYGKKENNNELANWEFCNDVNIGDIIFAKQGNKKILGYGIIKGKYYFNEKEEFHKSKINIKWEEIKDVNLDDIENINIKHLALKTLTNITKYPELIKYLQNKFSQTPTMPNTEKQFQKETKLLDAKKQIILYGPPGTGKTYNIKNIISEHSGEEYEKLKEEKRTEFVTFHQSFSYEEFIEGIKPDLENDSGEIKYKIEDGIFKSICEKAEKNYKNSLKTEEEIVEELNIENKLFIFLNSLLENKKELKKTKGGKFKIIDIINDKIKIFSEKSKYNNGELILKINDLLEIIKFKKEFKSSRELSKEVFGNEHQRQVDTYYFAIFNEYKKNKNDVSQENRNIDKKLKNYYLIIDEINRGNISKIFGELITLLEADKRIGGENEIKTVLPYSKEEFGIPENLFIIATMNTSDKSIVSLDTALRRRFGFVEMLPDYKLVSEKTELIEGIKLSELLQKLNNRIEYLLDKDHLIGHSYFLKVKNLDDLKLVFLNEIYPLLEEYFYGEDENIKKVLGKLFFENKNLNKNLFEEEKYFDIEEVGFKIKKNISDEDFIKVLENIIKNNNEEN